MVEHLLAKEKVAGSNPVFRSSVTRACPGVFMYSDRDKQYALGRSLVSAGVAEWQTLRS